MDLYHGKSPWKKTPFGRILFWNFFQASNMQIYYVSFENWSGRPGRLSVCFQIQAEKKHQVGREMTQLRPCIFPKIGVFPPKSSILIGFSIINHPFWGTTIFQNSYPYMAFPNLLLFGVDPARRIDPSPGWKVFFFQNARWFVSE